MDSQWRVRAIVCDEQNVANVADNCGERFNFWILCVWEVTRRIVEVSHGCR